MWLCEQVQKLGPLGWGDVLAHVDDAVHGYIRVGLHQATTQQENSDTDKAVKHNREAPPVGKHHERQTFTVEIANGLSCFKG
ncbi:hypothetical protein INR49_006195 [Caranx melampygus]|nr:hypothetical protein INR49_006195 [Caranx melampygus]